MTIEDYTTKMRTFYKRSRRLPSYKEMMRLFNFKSKNSVYTVVNKLVERNVIARDDSGKLIPVTIYGELRVLGTVEAGFPASAEEDMSETISLDEYLIKNGDATFMLKVSGDSMNDAGIVNGDMVLAERGSNPKNGDIVIAQVDDGWTMKFLDIKGKKVRLLPANKKFKPIIPKDELKIEAIVRAVIRKY